MPLRPRGGGRGGGGNANIGVLLRQTGETDKGLFLSSSAGDLTWHGRGESLGDADPAIGGHVDLPNNGGGPGVGRHGALRLQFPADISGFEGALTNGITVRILRNNRITTSPVVVWSSSNSILSIQVGPTTEIAHLVTAIAAFSTFTITTSLTAAAVGTDRFALPEANLGNVDHQVVGGRDEIPPGIELLAQPDDGVNGPNILAKYDPDSHTLQDVLDELEENDQGVTITVPYGTDLTAAPEAVPWLRGFDAGIGPTEAPTTGTGGLTQAQVDRRVRVLAKGYALAGGPQVPDSEIPSQEARDAEVPGLLRAALTDRAPDATNFNDEIPFVDSDGNWSQADTTTFRALFKPTLPEWSTIPGLFVFRVGDIVPHSGGLYYSKTEHQKANNGPDTGEANWQALRLFWGDWTARYYPLGSTVTHNGGLWFTPEDAFDSDPSPDNAANTKWIRIDRAAGIHDGGSWSAGATFTARELVRHTQPQAAAYLTLQDVPAGIQPGVTANWDTYYARIGWIDGAPDSVTSVRYDGDTGEIVSTQRGGHATRDQIPAGGTQVAANPDGTDGDVLRRIRVAGRDWNLPSGYLWYSRPALAQPEIADGRINNAGDGLQITLLDAHEFEGPLYADADFTTEWNGSLFLTMSKNGNIKAALTTEHSFSGKSFAHVRTSTKRVSNSQPDAIFFNNFNRVSRVAIGRYVTQDGAAVEITEADLQGPVTISYKLELTFEQDGSRVNVNYSDLSWGDLQTRSYQIAHGAGAAPSNEVRPHVSSFRATSGNLDPAAGSIAAQVYGVEWAIAQGDHVGAARILGFKGDFDASTATVLSTIPAGNYASGSGNVVVPNGTMLADGETYRFRLQVFGEGTTNPAIGATPASYQDIVITAHAPATANYHWGRVARVANQDAATYAAAIVFSDDDLVTGDALATTDGYDATPDANGNWIFYLAAKADQTQPAGWTSGAFPANAVFQSAVDQDYGGVSFKVYVMNDAFYRTADDGAVNYTPTA